MRRRAVIIGIVGGLVVGGAIGVLRGGVMRSSLQAVPLGEDRGTITRVVLHYQPAAGTLVAPIYTRLLSALDRKVRVVWVVGHASDLVELRARMGTAWPAGRSHPVVVGKDITTWAKDRCVVLRRPGDKALLCAPVRTRTANPLRTNDQEVPYRLAQEMRRWCGVRGSRVEFDGGDFLATERHLFATPAIIEKNARRVPSTAALTQHLRQLMAREVTWLGTRPGDCPPHHVGMFLTVFAQTAAVGDVRLAERIVAAHPETRRAFQVAGGEAPPAFRVTLRAQLDRVAGQMRALGYTVVRVPLLPSATPRAWMSYNNGIVETRGGRTMFYMPTFGAPALDAAAAEIFRREVGCRVVPIDCARIWCLGGSLHCLVNVVGRK